MLLELMKVDLGVVMQRMGALAVPSDSDLLQGKDYGRMSAYG